MTVDPLRIAMFSTATSGGAGAAALRVHDSVRLVGAQSTLFVGRLERMKHAGVVRLGAADEGRQPPVVSNFTIFSVDAPGIPDDPLERIIGEADVFNLHWCARFVSLSNIERMSRSGKPVVLTIRDMNPLTGGCHFFHGCSNWKGDCSPCPQFVQSEGALPSATLEAKKALWDLDNITVVVLSEHTRRIVEVSSLFARSRVETIANPIDTTVFRPQDSEHVRREFNITPQRRVIAYLPSFSSAVKGFDEAQVVLRSVSREMTGCLVLCAGRLGQTLDVGMDVVNVGFIADKRRLARFYGCADVTLVPSTEETFSNTAAESVACGTPVVGFETGAIAEIARRERGRAVPVGDTDALSSALAAILRSKKPAKAELHRYIANRFGARDIGRRYIRLFDELRADARADRVATNSSNAAADRRTEARARLDVMMEQYLERRGHLTLGLQRLLHAAKLFLWSNREFRRKLREKWLTRLRLGA